MESIIYIFCALLLIGSVIFAVDRHLWIKEIETDLKNYLGDILVAKRLSEDPYTVHFEAQALALKALIRKHFKL